MSETLIVAEKPRLLAGHKFCKHCGQMTPAASKWCAHCSKWVAKGPEQPKPAPQGPKDPALKVPPGYRRCTSCKGLVKGPRRNDCPFCGHLVDPTKVKKVVELPPAELGPYSNITVFNVADPSDVHLIGNDVYFTPPNYGEAVAPSGDGTAFVAMLRPSE